MMRILMIPTVQLNYSLHGTYLLLIVSHIDIDDIVSFKTRQHQINRQIFFSNTFPDSLFFNNINTFGFVD